jgi:hypothetical protein
VVLGARRASADQAKDRLADYLPSVSETAQEAIEVSPYSLKTSKDIELLPKVNIVQ